MEDNKNYFVLVTADVTWLNDKLTDHNGHKKYKTTTESIVLEDADSDEVSIEKIPAHDGIEEYDAKTYTTRMDIIATKAKTWFNNNFTKAKKTDKDGYYPICNSITQIRKTLIPSITPININTIS